MIIYPSSTPRKISLVAINISGLMHETKRETLQRYPETLLGDRKKSSKYFCPLRKEYFFERHRESFSSILYFYQSGRLYCPHETTLHLFLGECEFFQIPLWAIDILKNKEGGFLEDNLIDFLKPKKRDALTLRERMWYFFEDPTSTRSARYFSYFAIFLLICSIVINCLITVKELRPRLEASHHHDGWEITDILINIYFLVEFLLRFLVSLDKVMFFKSKLVWIDLVALISFIPLLNKHYSNKPVILFFTPFQLFRIVRIFRLTKLFPQFNVTEIIIRDCLGYIKVYSLWMSFIATIAAAVMYTLEKEEHATKFRSLPASLYWSIQTLVTLGYGDIIPRTKSGKLFASIFILGFVPTLCLPTLAILKRFARFYEFAKRTSE